MKKIKTNSPSRSSDSLFPHSSFSVCSKKARKTKTNQRVLAERFSKSNFAHCLILFNYLYRIYYNKSYDCAHACVYFRLIIFMIIGEYVLCIWVYGVCIYTPVFSWRWKKYVWMYVRVYIYHLCWSGGWIALGF